MPNQVRVGVGVTGASKASSDLDRFRDKFTNLQKQGAKGLAIGAGIGVFNAGVGLATEALGGLTSAFFDSIKAASDLNETENKSAVVFGDSAKAIDTWATNAATKIGMSKQAALEAAATFGNL